MKIIQFLQVAAPFVWLGFLIAISAEAYLKFQAPGITLPLGLGIGRLVFQFLNRAELVCAFILLVSFWTKPSSDVLILYGIIVAVLLVQTFFFLPALDQRALMVIDGKPRPDSNMHIYYVVCELIKILLLPILAYTILKQNFKFSL